jgi:SAM-dependent methyltransferase
VNAASPRESFGAVAGSYAAFRPRYPTPVFHYLSAIAPANRLALDVASGSGQATAGLCERFERVVAIDLSAPQLAAMSARPAARVVAHAEQLPIASQTVDLVLAAQALHWFDKVRFFDECCRVLRPGGVVAALIYTHAEIHPSIDRIVRRLHDDALRDDWAIDRHEVIMAYPSVRFPGRTLAMAQFVLEHAMTADAFLGYLSTWSAVATYRARTGFDPINAIRAELSNAWGDSARTVRWPLRVRASRV